MRIISKELLSKESLVLKHYRQVIDHLGKETVASPSYGGGDGGSSYSSNKTKLQSVFESGNCTEEVSEGVSEYRCSNSYPHSITVCSDGSVRTYIKPAYYCNIYADGSSGCYVLYS